MTRTLYLHLGPAKTGTSAVQHVLSRHDGSVVLYPKVGLWPDGSHHNLVLNYFKDYQRPDLVRVDPAQLLAQIGEEARASDRDIVISSEILAGRRILGGFVSDLQAAIGEECRVVLVVVAREHRERAASLYNQRVKDAVIGEIRGPDDFLTDHPERLCYTELLRRLEKTGLELDVINYHPAESFVERCLAGFGFALEQIPAVPRRNVSLGRVALIATLAANRAAGSREERAQFDAALTAIANRFARGDNLFSRKAVGAVRHVLLADRKLLRRKFDLQLPKGERPEQTSPFVISEIEFLELAAAAEALGDFGTRIREQLRTFVAADTNELKAAS